MLKNYLSVRKYTLSLCQNLQTEDFGLQAEEFVSPVKWHLAHTTWFFETFVLLPQQKSYRIFHPQFSFLFNSYYNNVGERVPRAQRGLLSRPTVQEVFDYREHVDTAMCDILTEGADHELAELVSLGLQHEQQHQELLLSDLKYNLYINPLRPSVHNIGEYPKQSEKVWLEVPGGMHKIGYQGNGFCYDNELGLHEVFLESFSISNQLVSNADFEEFIRDGGYLNSNFWHSDGWAWVQEHKREAPLYWNRDQDGYSLYTLAGTIKLIPDAPVAHVSYYEAAAYAEWAGKRLPTEFEWEAAAASFDWGSRWEWTQSAYLPYPRYQKAPGAIGEYNGKFMINQMVLRGASVATSPHHSRISYRNFFGPEAQWQFSGIRLVKDK